MTNKQDFEKGKRIIFTILTQGLLSIAAVVMGFGLPKFLSIDEYSRWQVYYFYVAYVNYLQLGFNDGLVLNLSGSSFENLPWKNLKRATVYIVSYLMFLSVVILEFGSFFDTSSFIIIRLLVYSFIPTVLMCICNAVLLAGNKTYQYNLFNLAIRLFFVVIMICGIIMKIKNAEFYIAADIISKFILVLIFWLCEKGKMIGTELVMGTGRFIKENCLSGIVVATTILILGLLPMCGRVLIQFKGDSADYARYSFAISMLSIILTFTNAVGTVAFPMLKNDKNKEDSKQYRTLACLYDHVLILCLWFLVIIEFVIYHFLQEYVPVLEYFPILMAICLPLGKIQSIIYPYYKLCRKEKEFLIISIAFLAVTFLVSYFLYSAWGLVGLSGAALLCVMIYDWALESFYQYKLLKEKTDINFLIYLIMVLFIICGKMLNMTQFALSYGSILLIYFCYLWKRNTKKDVV